MSVEAVNKEHKQTSTELGVRQPGFITWICHL